MATADDQASGVDLTEIQGEDKEFLEAVHDVYGEATTTDLRKETDLSRSQIHYRIKKFDDKGLLDVTPPKDTGGNDPTRFELSSAGLQVVDSGILEQGTDPDRTLQTLANAVKTLQERVETVEVNTSTDPHRSFTQRQQDHIRWEIGEEISHMERTESRFWFEIFPTIASELGYPTTGHAPAPDAYLEEFAYTTGPDAEQPDKPTIAERLSTLEERVDELADKIEG